MELKNDIKQMESLGVADIYLSLLTFIKNFINKNYPLTPEDMQAIVNEKITDNIIKRNEAMHIMKNSAIQIIEAEKADNQEYIKSISSNSNCKALTVEELQQKIFNYKEQILESLWLYQHQNEDNEQHKRDI